MNIPEMGATHEAIPPLEARPESRTLLMKGSLVHRLIVFIWFGCLFVVAAEPGMPASSGNTQNQTQRYIFRQRLRPEENSSAKGIDEGNSTLSYKQTPIDRKAAMEVEKRAVDAYNSGLVGITTSIVMSGVPGRQPTGEPTSIEFAIAPIEDDNPAYGKAIFVRSDRQGKYKVALPPGRYWIGPRAKALDPAHYRPRGAVLSEKEAVVNEDVFTQLDLLEVGYAP